VRGGGKAVGSLIQAIRTLIIRRLFDVALKIDGEVVFVHGCFWCGHNCPRD
jgi:G:T-mismatch repair DNA endonuclease (very short patch repair protein)